jgi:chemotaxis protein methyltransferase CheR
MQSTFSDDNFSYIKKFLYENSGYHLMDTKIYLLESRLKPLLKKYDLDDYNKIINQVRLNPRSALSADVVENMTVNETFFFRDDTPFRILRETVLPPYIKNEDEIKIWSAACSTGQEPYSIAMTTEEIRRGYPNFKYEIHASDISKSVVQRARDGIFMNHEVERGLPSLYKKRYFDSIEDNNWKIRKTMRDSILFFEQNLCDAVDNFRGPYDIIFLRNVLIYFDNDTKLKVLQKISKAMKSGAYLFLGTSENIYDMTLGFERQPDLSGIYKKK